MAESVITGIRVAEQPGPEEAIVGASTAVTAFVGRTLRGPVNRSVTVASFSEYQAIFGGLWQPSLLSYAIEQFFENGGRTAVVVRVDNGGRPPTLVLPAGGECLTLQALEPGTREFLRASVDYDGIGANEDDRFNLILQRVRSPGSEYIEDQEIFRRVSVRPDASRCVLDVLTGSSLARLIGEVPTVRPDRTFGPGGGGMVGYVHSNPDGDDGAPLTDYDVIGSGTAGTGLFSLKEADAFNLLCIPPLSRDSDLGPSALFVAARFCRERNAMLLVDPPSHWHTADDALRGMRDWQLHSENALMYFPRMLGYDRLRGRFEKFSAGGAIAGMLARNDELWPLWSATEAEDPILRPGFRPVCPVSEAERQKLAQSGVNTLLSVRTSEHERLSTRTLAASNGAAAGWKYLTSRRLSLYIVNSIERGTRWAVFETNGPTLRRRLENQVASFLEKLDSQGAFLGHPAEDSWFVVCDERLNGPEELRTGTVNILFGFAAQRPGEHHAYIVSQSPALTRVRPASVNRTKMLDLASL